MTFILSYNFLNSKLITLIKFYPNLENKSFNEPLKLMTFILSYNFLNSKLIAALKDICQ